MPLSAPVQQSWLSPRPVAADQAAMPAHVLVAAEDAAELISLAKGLRRASYHVSEARNITEAVQLVQRLPPSLVLIGIGAPGTWGMHLAEHLSAEQETPFMVLAADSEPGLVARAGALGAIGYLVKPLHIAQIVPAIGAALARAAQINTLIEKGDRLEHALAAGREISMATGVLMERCGLDRTRAFETLRARARAERRRLHDLAAEMLDAVEKVNRLRPTQ